MPLVYVSFAYLLHVCVCMHVCVCVCVCMCVCVLVCFSYVIITFVAEVALYSVSAFVLRGNAWAYVKRNPEVALYLILKSDSM
jgi:hypothetical protein